MSKKNSARSHRRHGQGADRQLTTALDQGAERSSRIKVQELQGGYQERKAPRQVCDRSNGNEDAGEQGGNDRRQQASYDVAVRQAKVEADHLVEGRSLGGVF
jgi:hypothetical protein